MTHAPSRAIQAVATLLFALHSFASALSISTGSVASSLSKEIRRAYHHGGTIGVLQWSSHTLHHDTSTHSASILVRSALDASRGDKGKSSGILNAFIGSCCYDSSITEHEKSAARAGLAVNLMAAYDEIEGLKPDLMALSLAFAATRRTNAQIANRFLERAVALSSADKTCIQTLGGERWEDLQSNHGVKLLQNTDAFAVVSKPSGMVCFHTGQSNPRNHIGDQSLEACLLAHGIPLSTLNTEGRGLVHRIDRGTSGCLVIAKTDEMHALLMAEFFLRNVKKSYQALVDCTELDLLEKGSMNLPIGGRPAESCYTVLERINFNVTLLRITTQQGRKHQVRIHCSKELKAPILLDPLYGGEKIMFQLKSPAIRHHRAKKKFCLHAATLAIPNFGIDAQTPIPDWWLDLSGEEAASYSSISTISTCPERTK